MFSSQIGSGSESGGVLFSTSTSLHGVDADVVRRAGRRRGERVERRDVTVRTSATGAILSLSSARKRAHDVASVLSSHSVACRMTLNAWTLSMCRLFNRTSGIRRIVESSIQNLYSPKRLVQFGSPSKEQCTYTTANEHSSSVYLGCASNGWFDPESMHTVRLIKLSLITYIMYPPPAEAKLASPS